MNNLNAMRIQFERIPRNERFDRSFSLAMDAGRQAFRSNLVAGRLEIKPGENARAKGVASSSGTR
jgi:hypothetical protein